MRQRLVYKVLVCIMILVFLLTGCTQEERIQPTTTPNVQETGSESPSPVTDKKDNFPEWSYDATIYEVNIRQYTPEGTFKAFEAHLPRLKEMGVEILWFMPIYPISEVNRKGTLGSYYSIADYKNINPEFGTLDDFKNLVNRCHEMGFKVMLDWVANHTGWDNTWINEHKDWYTTNKNGDIIPPNADWSDVADLNFDNQDMRAAMLDAMTFWVKEYDVDGFRCDYATGVPLDFWEATRNSLEEIKPVFMLAEDDRSMAFMKYAFNANYGWSLFKNLNSIAKGTYKPSSLISYFESLQARYPEGTYPMHFIDNHDENSWNGTVEERMGEAQYPMLALIFTTPGIPMIYSGQEADLNKRLQFFEKDEIDWSALPNSELITTLVKLKQDHPALWNGNQGGTIAFNETGDTDVLCYERVKDDDRVVVLLNLSKKDKTVTITFNQAFQGIDILTGQQINYVQGSNSIQLKPWEFIIGIK